MNASVRGWLGFTLSRLALWASPVDGFHVTGMRRTRRDRSASEQAPIRLRPGQTQFVRGLS